MSQSSHAYELWSRFRRAFIGLPHNTSDHFKPHDSLIPIHQDPRGKGGDLISELVN